MKGQIWPAVIYRFVLLFRDSSVNYQSWLMCIMNAVWFTSNKMARDNSCIKFCSFDLHDAIRTWVCSTRQISQQSYYFLSSWHLVLVSNEDAILIQHWHPTSSLVLFRLPVVLVSSSGAQLRFFFSFLVHHWHPTWFLSIVGHSRQSPVSAVFWKYFLCSNSKFTFNLKGCGQGTCLHDSHTSLLFSWFSRMDCTTFFLCFYTIHLKWLCVKYSGGFVTSKDIVKYYAMSVTKVLIFYPSSV